MTTLLAIVHRELPLNSGFFRAFELTSPAGCLVNPKFPKSVELGHNDGPFVLSQLVRKAWSQLDKNWEQASSGFSRCTSVFKFSSGQWLRQDVLPGLGAGKLYRGENAVDLAFSTGREPSIELLEKELPIVFTTGSLRGLGGGEGRESGGRGEARGLKMLADAEVLWSSCEFSRSPLGFNGGKAGLPAEIIVHRDESGEREKLPESGSIHLKAGDSVTFLAAGAGGFGEAPSSQKTEP